jgi:hypothetical protein
MARARYVQVNGQLIEVPSERTRSPDSDETLLAELENSSCIDEYVGRLAAETVPPRLYHYTNKGGLEGMLQSGTFWLSNVFRLNDDKEIRYGVEAACGYLLEAAAEPNATEVVQLVASTVSAKLRESIEGAAHFFTCSFSLMPDDPHQWRQYGDQGRGYALAMNTDVLQQHFVGVAPANHSTFRMSYSADGMRAMQRTIVARALDILRRIGATPNASFLQRFSVGLSISIIHCSTFFKSARWSDEHEYRFLMVRRVDLPVPNERSRDIGGRAVRYWEYDWKTDCAAALAEIIVGPEADAAFAERLCAELFPEHRVRIRRSSVAVK